ncbi:MAG: pyruvate:ferredoxin (flavodoxin) oxidoreductase [Gammaproteobacteria bacterium]|nr:pyruvate:ferredoxin (flavodoxin) oxidoreductase [Gammaproteobacteria bacterium]
MSTNKIMDGNEAAVKVAYKVSEVMAIYPITPSTTMGELAEDWSTSGVKNIWGTIPKVMEMQSEGGAAGAFHGALQTGALASTFTASQGLLLMIPNMYKVAGELTSAVIHVAARSLATHALSIFGDHSDVMAVRDTGFALLASNSVQEAHDLALIAHAATLEARVPFLHFFDGFRTSHEINKVSSLTDEQIHALIDDDLVAAHRRRALTPERGEIHGTAQNPDVYFQGREAVNKYYAKVPEIVEKYMQQFSKVIGRNYQLMSYSGALDAERVVIVIGSAACTTRNVADYLSKQGEKVGVLEVHLFRPFSAKHLINALPKTIKSVAVLERTKESGALGEPLYLDVITAFRENNYGSNITIIGGRYGLSSKEFSLGMAKGVFDELKKANPKNHFTVGINDDVTHTSLDYDKNFVIEDDQVIQAMFFGLGADGTVGANKNSIKIIGEETDYYIQGYFVYDSKKAGGRTVSHLRFGPKPILAPYLILDANFIGCHQFNFLDNTDVLEYAKPGATFLLNSPFGPDKVWENLPKPVQAALIAKKINFYVIDADTVAEKTGMGGRINTIMQTCFFAISGVLPREEAIGKIKESITKTYKRKGEEVVKKNFAAVDQTLANLFKVDVPSQVSAGARELPPVVSKDAPEFVQKVTAVIMAGKGDDLPVSAFPVDGAYPSGTSQWEKRGISSIVAEWNPDMCIQCGQCSLICPHAVIRAKHFKKDALSGAPKQFKTVPAKAKEFAGDEFRLQIYVDDCTGCGLCNVVCPAVSKENREIKAMMLSHKAPRLEAERENIKYFEKFPYADRTKVDNTNVRGVQYLRPLFEFSSACSGCGETPYLKLVSQLFGDRMLGANATGCTSIYGGNLPTTPWAFDAEGRGPAWANSLFEDNAEFGFGYRLAIDKHTEQALEMLLSLKGEIGADLVDDITKNVTASDEKAIFAQRERIAKLKAMLNKINSPVAKRLLLLVDNLVKRSVWLIGGDGWAYDIGFGGLDHVLASGRNVNALVLDTEVYSNTGGQASKATPCGAVAKFAASGKEIPRKDLGLMMMSYGNVYVAQISIGANPQHAIKAILEAESYAGPSLVIAYSHCVAHGFNMKNGVEQQKLAVKSGFWPLYRYNPERVKENLNPFQLDSAAPTISVKDYAYNEPRFKVLVSQDPARAEMLINKLQDGVNRKWKQYSDLAKAIQEAQSK